MVARFVGGSEDGKTRFVPHVARCYLVPLPTTTGSLEDFLDLDYETEYQIQRYRRVWYDEECNEVVYLFERIE